MWSVARDDVATIVRKDIRTTKLMFTMVWSPRAFHMINRLPDGRRMNSGYYITNVLRPLHEKFCSEGPEDCGRPCVQFADAPQESADAPLELAMLNRSPRPILISPSMKVNFPTFRTSSRNFRKESSRARNCVSEVPTL
jgi:hypothetical protein